MTNQIEFGYTTNVLLNAQSCFGIHRLGMWAGTILKISSTVAIMAEQVMKQGALQQSVWPIIVYSTFVCTGAFSKLFLRLTAPDDDRVSHAATFFQVLLRRYLTTVTCGACTVRVWQC